MEHSRTHPYAPRRTKARPRALRRPLSPPGVLQPLTCVHVSAVVSSEAAAAPPAAPDVPAPATAPHVGGWRGLVVHGAPSHPEIGVVLLGGHRETRGSLWGGGEGGVFSPKKYTRNGPGMVEPSPGAWGILEPKFRKIVSLKPFGAQI